MSEFSAAGSKPTLLPKDQTTPYLYSPDPNDPVFQKRPLLYAVELHRRLSEWLYPIAFAVIGIGACGMARTNRQPAVVAMLNAVCAAFLLRWSGIFAENMAESRKWAGLLVYFVPLLVIFIPLWMAANNKPIEWPAAVRKWFAARAASVSNLATVLRIRLSGFRRQPSGETP